MTHPHIIYLRIVNYRWHWQVEGDDCQPIAKGSSEDYSTACADALAAWDKARKVTP